MAATYSGTIRLLKSVSCRLRFALRHISPRPITPWDQTPSLSQIWSCRVQVGMPVQDGLAKQGHPGGVQIRSATTCLNRVMASR